MVNGRVNALKMKHIEPERNCAHLAQEYNRLSIKKLIAPFVILSIGFVATTCLLLLEFRSKTRPGKMVINEEKLRKAVHLIRSRLDQVTNLNLRQKYQMMSMTELTRHLKLRHW